MAEEQNQRIDLMQKYSEETCTRVHLPGGLLLFLVLPKVYSEYCQKYSEQTCTKPKSTCKVKTKSYKSLNCRFQHLQPVYLSSNNLLYRTPAHLQCRGLDQGVSQEALARGWGQLAFKMFCFKDHLALPWRCTLSHFSSTASSNCSAGEEGWSAQELKSLPELTPPNIMPRQV